MRLLTRPLLVSEKASDLGTAGDIGLYDFSKYAVSVRGGIMLARSEHPGFTRDTTYFRAIWRGDGAPRIGVAYTSRSGTTLSPFVVLEDD
jgi:HK97 family phage major capsid protein